MKGRDESGRGSRASAWGADGWGGVRCAAAGVVVTQRAAPQVRKY